jgi:ribosome-associated protein
MSGGKSLHPKGVPSPAQDEQLATHRLYRVCEKRHVDAGSQQVGRGIHIPSLTLANSPENLELRYRARSGVDLMEDLVVGSLTIPSAELEERFETSGGPGGQHANRSETAVRLRFQVNESSLPVEAREKLASRLGNIVEVSAAESRSQHQNREMARRRLAQRIEEALVDPEQRRKTRPTRASADRRLIEKKARSEVKKQRRRPGIDD